MKYYNTEHSLIPTDNRESVVTLSGVVPQRTPRREGEPRVAGGKVPLQVLGPGRGRVYEPGGVFIIINFDYYLIIIIYFYHIIIINFYY